MTVAERNAVADMLHALLRVAYRLANDAERVELISQWRETYDALCEQGCAMERPT